MDNNRLTEECVVVDGNLITSRGPGTTSDLCCLLNGLPEYNRARKKTGKKPLEYLNEECSDIVYTRRYGPQDWVYLITSQTENESIENAEPEELQTASEKSQPESDEENIMEMGDLTIDEEPLTAEEQENSTEEPAELPRQEENGKEETDYLTAVMECIRQAEGAEKNARGHVRASYLRDTMMKLPAFRLLQKESGQKPIPFLKEKFTGSIRFYQENNIWWAAEGTQEEKENTETSRRQITDYDETFTYIEKKLSNAGVNQEAAEEIANICMHSNAAIEPRKVIHSLLCRRFGSKIGGQYYKKAIMYAGM